MVDKRKLKQQDLFTEAHKNYEKELTSYAFFKTHSNTTSQDLVQETFTKTWSYLVKGGKIEMMKAFLFHTLNNLVVDEYRKRKTTSLDVLLEKNGYEPNDDYSERLSNTFDSKKAVLLIQHLPIKYREVMYMRYKQGLSLEEMSIQLRQTRNATAVQLHRGLRKLGILYENQCNR